MGRSQPRPQRLPFEEHGRTSNTASYGFFSPSADDPNVRAYLDVPIGVDPGVQRQTDLAEQRMELGWNSDFASGIPEQLRLQQEDVGRREFRSAAAARAQQAEYLQNQLELARRAALLPQFAQTGSTGTADSSGYRSDFPGQSGTRSAAITGGATVAAAAIFA